MMRSLLLLCLFLLLSPFASEAADFTLDEATRAGVTDAVARELDAKYVFKDVGRDAAKRLREANQRGDYARFRDGEAFAQRLSADLQAWTGDGHLNVEYSADPLPEEDAEANEAYARQETERYYGAHLNFGFEKVERLDGNIGLLDLRVFAPTAMGGDTAVAAMQFLAHTDALIIDLRRNGGGDGEMADLLSSYLFDRVTPLNGEYSRIEDKTTISTTLNYVPGTRFGPSKPVLILVSKKTFSAAEGFAYALQALGRATIIGEPTGGGAHPFDYQKVSPHFVLWLVTSRSINPITGGNWQGTGVQPDKRVNAERALDVALDLAKDSLADAAN